MLAGAVEALRHGDLPKAAGLARELCDSKAFANDPAARMQLADLCMHCELFFDARAIYREFEPDMPDDVSLHYKSGTAAYKTRDILNAGRHFERCTELRPEHPAAYLQLGHIRKAERQFDTAASCYRDYIERSDRDKGHGYWSLADLRGFEMTDRLIEEMHAHLGRCDASGPEASIVRFALAMAAEQQGDFADALEHFKAANAIQAKLRPFRGDAFRGLMNTIRDTAIEVTEAEAASGRPVFIVGLPRSGTTLVEQILAAHSKVQATDELPFMERIGMELERNGGYGARLAAMSSAERERYRQRYLRESGQYLADTNGWFIDKNPNNFMHIGLIRCLLPEALIINLRRDLRDNAISLWRQMFVVGHDYSSDFTNIIAYASEYLRIMQHWQELCPAAIRENAS